MSNRVGLLLTIITLHTLAQITHSDATPAVVQNFHMRGVYYNYWDNPCNSSPRVRDQVILNIQMVGKSTKIATVWTDTTCGDYGSMYVSSSWSFTEYGKAWYVINRINFKQAVYYYEYFGVLKLMLVNTTIQNPASTVDEQPYNCTIAGTGEVMHFGITGDKPCRIYVRCTQDPKIQTQDSKLQLQIEEDIEEGMNKNNEKDNEENAVIVQE